MSKSYNNTISNSTGKIEHSCTNVSSPGDESSISGWHTKKACSARTNTTKQSNYQPSTTQSSSRFQRTSSPCTATIESANIRQLQETLAKEHDSYKQWVHLWLNNCKKEDTWNKLKWQFHLQDYQEYYNMLTTYPIITQHFDIMWNQSLMSIQYKSKWQSDTSNTPCVKSISKPALKPSNPTITPSNDWPIFIIHQLPNDNPYNETNEANNTVTIVDTDDDILDNEDDSQETTTENKNKNDKQNDKTKDNYKPSTEEQLQTIIDPTLNIAELIGTTDSTDNYGMIVKDFLDRYNAKMGKFGNFISIKNQGYW